LAAAARYRRDVQTAQSFRLNEKSSAHSLSGGGIIRNDAADNLFEVIERERQ